MLTKPVFHRTIALLLTAATITMSAAAQTYSSKQGTTVPSTPSAKETYDTTGGPVQFMFHYETGDHYRILSTVNEDAYLNMKLNNHATILNRITATVKKVNPDGSAEHDATFMTTENSVHSGTGDIFTYGEDYESIFTRNEQGVYTIGDEYFMPVVRDVPVFPNKAVYPGDTWTANGHEAHDLRRMFNIEKPYKVPVTATYTYLGTIKKTHSDKKEQTYASASAYNHHNETASIESQVLYVINVKYSLYYESPSPLSSNDPYSDWPATTMGFSNQIIYWDAEKGAIDHYKENFRILMETAYGNLIEYRGDAHAEVTEIIQTNTGNDVDKVQKEVDKLGLQNVTVKQGEKGLTISLDDIKFKADSAELLDTEKDKLRQIATILTAYPDNDILVSGHTALAGTAAVRQQLSIDRANAVADYLMVLGVRDRYHVFTQGFGATKPVASNDTEAGKAKNRRVEITIMDK